jgi:hypothetical protein
VKEVLRGHDGLYRSRDALGSFDRQHRPGFPEEIDFPERLEFPALTVLLGQADRRTRLHHSGAFLQWSYQQSVSAKVGFRLQSLL